MTPEVVNFSNMIKKNLNLMNERNERKNKFDKFEKIEKLDRMEKNNAVINSMLSNLSSLQQDLALKLGKDLNPSNLKTMSVKSDNKTEKSGKSPMASSKNLPKGFIVHPKQKEEEKRSSGSGSGSSSINKIITVDLSTPKIEMIEKRPAMRNFVNTKVVNLDLSAINDRKTSKEKVFDRSKSDKLFDLNKRSESVSKKFVHVPTVKTTLYSEDEVYDNIKKTNNTTFSRNSSVSLKAARSLSKAQKTSSNNESLNDSEVSLCLSDNNVNFNFNSIKVKLEEIKKIMLPHNEQKSRRSVSPIKINYGTLNTLKINPNLKGSTPTNKANFNLTGNSNENEDLIQFIMNSTNNEDKPQNNKDNKLNLQNYINFQNGSGSLGNGKQNIRFLNLVRSKKKKLDEIFKV
jgi:hypothetical protein